MSRMFEDLERDYVGGRRRRVGPRRPLSRDEAAERYRVLQERVAEAAPQLRRDGDTPPDGFGEFVGRAEALLDSYAREHGHGGERLLR
jgi:hypothetical protein